MAAPPQMLPLKASTTTRAHPCYSGDVWPEQPAPPDHPWRKMPRHAMTPHYSGDTIDAQRRIAAGVREMLELWFQHKPFSEDFYIVREGKLAEQYT
ncbi:hypothetical protein CVIRNUC_010373 [Coccomyxa viridis]|uniref:Formate dehydrogenase n=1 Tax=Coccomyxa viridis TaxID=1274662 RepID=A0AAV1IIU0_9CHLO|nr:hypothetical protein CVIRNUC_010373 [Coccomyxa viridis]